MGKKKVSKPLRQREQEGLKEFKKWLKANKYLFEQVKKELEKDE